MAADLRKSLYAQFISWLALGYLQYVVAACTLMHLGHRAINPPRNTHGIKYPY